MCLSEISLVADYINGIQFVVERGSRFKHRKHKMSRCLISLIKFNHRYCKEHCFLGILIKLQRSYLV